MFWIFQTHGLLIFNLLKIFTVNNTIFSVLYSQQFRAVIYPVFVCVKSKIYINVFCVLGPKMLSMWLCLEQNHVGYLKLHIFIILRSQFYINK